MRGAKAVAVVLLLAATSCASAPSEDGPVGAPPAPGGTVGTGSARAGVRLQEYPVPSGSRPHDVAPAADGTVWYTAQGSGELGLLDPATGRTTHVPVGTGSAPHGVVVGPDGAAWVTDGGLNAVVRVDPASHDVRRFPLPPGRPAANLNTATFDGRWREWPLPGTAPRPYAVYSTTATWCG